MAPTCFTSYNLAQQQQLLALARQSIEYGLVHHQPLPVDIIRYPEPLQQLRACFVTLEVTHHLRGCIGTLEAHRPLVEDVAHNAYAAAFRDPRFSAVTADELGEISVHISVLTPPEPMQVTSEQDLLQQLQPGIDGLILSDGVHRATFLPVVWESLPTPEEFLTHLKLKAGLPSHYWSDTLRFQRYQTEMFE